MILSVDSRVAEVGMTGLSSIPENHVTTDSYEAVELESLRVLNPPYTM